MSEKPARRGRSAALAVLSAGVVASLAAGCSVSSEPVDEKTESRTVTLVTHDSWAMSKSVVSAFEKESGYRLQVLPSGDAGELTNKLVLTSGNPLGDVTFGIDNTFASRAVDEGVLAPYTAPDLPASAGRYALPDAASSKVLTPVDWGDVCVNVDDRWFTDHHKAPPTTLKDLTAPAYKDLLVTPAASTSSPGFAFLLATIAKYGDGWQDYWRRLMANGAKVVNSWSDAYEVDFTGGGGSGDRPIVVSYNSSPPFTIPQGGSRPTTSALLDTCFRQVEYAGVLDGAKNVAGARALIDFMVGRRFQEALPDNMYVFPVDADAGLPPVWAKWAKPAPHPLSVPPADVASRRSEWLSQWSDLTSR